MFDPVVVSLSIEADSVRALVTQGRRVSRWGSLPLEPGLVKDGLVAHTEEVGAAIRQLLDSLKVKGPTATGMSGFHSVHRFLTLPHMPRDLMEKAVLKEASGIMPLSLEEAYFSWQFLFTKDGQDQVFALSVPRELLDAQVQALRQEIGGRYQFGNLTGKSPAMQEVYRFVELASTSSAPVLISGETGTGKELVARTIHDMSMRAKGPFVAVNCSAIPETLLESELFGHEKGAFTGALERRAGYFELAAAGTIFLDEITEMSPALQAKYLRVLQDGVIRRLGAKGELSVDVRVVAATNRDAAQAVQDKALREDLYYRINVLNISLPPLRSRLEDLALLVDAFIIEFNEKYERKVKSVDDATMARLREHGWPGNVRELRNIIERAVVGSAGDLITPESLPFVSPPTTKPVATDAVILPLGTTLEQGERELIQRTLESVKNNKTRAAAILGTTPKTLHNKARRWRCEAAEMAGS